jgi:PAS domain S-box-containing protein
VSAAAQLRATDQPVRLLVLEDDATDRMLVEETLRRCADTRFELTCFPRLAPALACLKTRGFDAAVMDMVLPDAAGLEVFARIRAAAPSLPVVVLTGIGDADRFDALLKAGAQDCLVKLHPLGQLLPRAIRYAMERQRIHDELRRSEAEIRARENHLAAAQRLASVGSFEIDFASGAFTCSRELLTIHGLDTCAGYAELVERSVARDERGHLLQTLEAARGGQMPPPLEYRFGRSDGQARRAERQCEVLRDDSGRPSGVLGVVRDITALREAEARQAEIGAQLRQAQKIDALGTLAGGIAHDLNNTLLPIRTLAPLLKRGPGRSEQDMRALDLILSAAQRASHLVQQILAFSRKQEVERLSLRLDELVRDSLPMMRAGLPPHVRIDTDIAPVPDMLGNRGQLYQVVLNFVLNAAQAIGDRPGAIAIAVAPDAGGVRLSVTDTGCGMSEETQSRIFEPFFTTRAASEGTGLGLSVVKGIVTEHDGTIAVTSRPGAGTRFDVVFPAA